MMKFVLVLLTLLLTACTSNRESAEYDHDDEVVDTAIAPVIERNTDPHIKSYIVDWPVNEARLTQRFLPFKRKPHLGIDLAGPKGSHIFSAHHGTVIYSGRSFHGYGKLVIVEQNDSWATFYSHLQKILVREGQMVQQGQLIGLMGRTGNARGTHLHFELRNDRNPVDPLQFLPGGQSI